MILFLLLWSALPQVGSAQSETARQIAHCTGRFSAELENAWLMQPGASEQTLAMRTEFERLLDAVTPPEEAAQALNARIDAKFAHAALLQRANFDPDAAVRRRAAKMAQGLTARCANLLLRG